MLFCSWIFSKFQPFVVRIPPSAIMRGPTMSRKATAQALKREHGLKAILRAVRWGRLLQFLRVQQVAHPTTWGVGLPGGLNRCRRDDRGCLVGGGCWWAQPTLPLVDTDGRITSRLSLLGGSCLVSFVLRVCESVAFDEVHDEIGYGFQRHEKQHCQAHGQGAIAPVKQPPSGDDC